MGPLSSKIPFRCLSLHSRTAELAPSLPSLAPTQSAELAPSLPLPACVCKVPVQVDWVAHWLPCRSLVFLNRFLLPHSPFSFALSKFCPFFKAHQAQVPSV